VNYSPALLAALGLRSEWAEGKSARRLLAAAGHPGYGEAHARRALVRMAEFGLTAHEALYGGLAAARKMEAGR
jgi:hypothetical protein